MQKYLAIVFVFLALVFASALLAFKYGQATATVVEQQACQKGKDAALAKSEDHAIELENKVIQAQKEGDQREQALQKSLSDSRVAVDRLREQLADARTRIGEASSTAVAEYANTLSDVFGECVQAYTELAGQAQGHANDAVMLMEAWPHIR